MQASYPQHQYKILVVEDNIINRKVLTKQLELLGYTPVSVVNGKLAIDYLAEHEVDCVLMDCQMPVMDGYAATAAIRQRVGGDRQVIIGLTAYSDEAALRRCLEIGMDDYLEKPASSAELEAVLAKFLAGRSPRTKPESQSGAYINSALQMCVQGI